MWRGRLLNGWLRLRDVVRGQRLGHRLQDGPHSGGHDCGLRGCEAARGGRSDGGVPHVGRRKLRNPLGLLGAEGGGVRSTPPAVGGALPERALTEGRLGVARGRTRWAKMAAAGLGGARRPRGGGGCRRRRAQLDRARRTALP